MGAWIEIKAMKKADEEEEESLLSWERGLKFYNSQPFARPLKSLLSWERGLKYDKKKFEIRKDEVAPLVGAWIEIIADEARTATPRVSLLSWERGLKYVWVPEMQM